MRVRIFKPAAHKGAQKTWDEVLCDAAAVVCYEDAGHVLLGMFGDGCVRAYSLPALKEMATLKVDDVLDVRRFSDATITSSGESAWLMYRALKPRVLTALAVFGWTGPARWRCSACSVQGFECALMAQWLELRRLCTDVEQQ